LKNKTLSGPEKTDSDRFFLLPNPLLQQTPKGDLKNANQKPLQGFGGIFIPIPFYQV